MHPTSFNKYFDHTMLKPDATRADIEKAVQEAKSICAASVCIHPSWVITTHELLEGTDILAGAAIGFPMGMNTIETKAAEARQAIADGAGEFDYVIHIGKAKEHDWDYIQKEMEAMKAVAKEAGIVFKVIFETCYLSPEEIDAVAKIASVVQPDFIKTSTGFGPAGATVENVRRMKAAAGEHVSIKASGGIRDLSTALAMIDAGADRIGCSASVSIFQEWKQHHSSLEDLIRYYYMQKGYNCAETLLHAANDYYDLNIAQEDCKMMAGFGAGMYSGQICGALAASIAALSKKIIHTKAHDQIPELSRADRLVVKNFTETMNGTSCAQIKPAHFDKQTRCLSTVLLAAQSLEKSMEEILGQDAELF